MMDKAKLRKHLIGFTLAILINASSIHVFIFEGELYAHLVASVSLVLLLFITIRLHKFKAHNILYLALCFILIFSFLPSLFIYGDSNLLYLYILITSLSLGYLSSCLYNEYITDKFINYTIIISCIISLLIIFGSIVNGGDYRSYWKISNYLALGISLSIPFCFIISKIKYTNTYSKYDVILLFVLFIGIILSQSRSALIFSIILSTHLIFKGKLHSFSFKNIAISLFMVVAMIFLILNFIPDRTLIKIFEFGPGNIQTAETSTGVRFLIWENTISLIQNSPIFGYGIGHDLPNRFHPHNLFLQVTVDGGIIALIPIIILILFPIIFFHKNRTPSNFILYGLYYSYLFLVLEFSKSHLIYYGRELFIVGGLLLGASYYFKSKYKRHIK